MLFGVFWVGHKHCGLAHPSKFLGGPCEHIAIDVFSTVL